MGKELRNNFDGVFGGIIGGNKGLVYLKHELYPKEPPLTVSNGAFSGKRAWTGIPNSRTGGTDSVPGKVFIIFVDGITGYQYNFQRNIDYGSNDGSQMFLLDLRPINTVPSMVPSLGSQYKPSTKPSKLPSFKPSSKPTVKPTSMKPIKSPTMKPSFSPSRKPTSSPSTVPLNQNPSKPPI